MANEFIIKRGFESKGSSQVTGSLSVSSNIIADGTIAGSNLSGTNTGDQDLSALALKTAISGAFVAPSASFSTRVTANDAKLTANTTNVSNAGALMDSEVTDIATIKSLTKAGISGSFVASSASFSTRTTVLESNPVFSSTMISGSFVAPSSSFSTRVTFLEEGGAVGFTSSGISGSLGPNATLIRSLTATGISGSSTESSASFSTRVSSLETKSVFSGSLLGNGSAINSINASNISSGTIAAARVATLNQNTTGNAATATTLATARNINGVSFDGSADITTVEGNTGGTGATLTAITIGTTEFTVATGTGNGNVETSGTPLDNDYAKFTSGYQIEGRSTSEVKTDLSLNNVENTALSTYTGNGGALDNQYIANGRGFALKTAISGAFVASSASFSTRVTGNALGMSTNASNISSNTSNITSNASNITNNRSLITGITSSLDTVGRMVFVGSNGTLTSEAGFAYNATTNQLSVDSLNVIHLTSSFITASNIKTSGSNIFGDSTSDTQTFIGTTFISGAAQITGSLGVSANIKSSGTVIGSNLSGTNTGDQDLSALALKTSISGSFTAPSSSFSTRVTLNDAKLTANTTNVTSAGALMDSELADIATVKSLTKAGISGSFGSPSSSFSTRVTFLEQGGAVGFTSAGISGSFGAPSASFSTRVTANDAKLTANTSNVTTAGALMDSEVTDLAGIKGVTISTLQPKPSEGAFANGDKTKLDGIEASADVTDTANVTSAGALMDSELTSRANVIAINQSLVSGATPAFTTTNFTDASNKRLMTDAQETKLDSVETDADVTDTANVTSAGALMDSELAEIATVKLLTKSGISGSFTELSASLSNRAKFTSIWDVVSPSGGQYEFKGPGLTGTENKPALYLTRGEQYQFNINASGHPFYIQTSAGAYNSGNVYNDGVTGNGTQVGDLDFNVQFDAPTKLYYVCSAHSGMGNIIYIDDFIPETAATASYVAGANVDGAVATATLATDATTLATPRAINGVNFDGSAPITITAAGSTLSDTVTVAKGGTGATSLTATRVLIGNGTSAITSDSGFTYSSNVLSTEGLTITSTSAQNSEATALMINGSNVVGTRELGSNAFNSTTIGTNTNALTVDNATIKLNTGTTFNGSAARTISIKDGGVDSDALAASVAGDGLTGGGGSALTVGAGTGIDVSSDAIAVDVSDFMTNGSNNRIVTATGTDAMNAEANLTFDGSTLTLTGVLNIPGFSNVSASLAAAGTGTALTASYVAGGNVDGAVATATLAADATTLATPRAINGVNFDGSAPITITAAAGTLSGNTLKSTVLASSLTSVGTLSALEVTGDLEVGNDIKFGTTDAAAQHILDAQDDQIISITDGGLTKLIAAGNLDIGAHTFRASTFYADVATGTAPFTVTSTTPVANLQAATATILHTARNINGVSFNGSADITITAAGSTLSDTVTVAKGGTGATTLGTNQILIGQGTSAVTTDSGFSYASNILNTEGLNISSVSEQNSEATSLMINGDGVVGIRELGSNAFNSTAIPTAAMISGSFTATSSSFSSRIAANEIITAKTLISGSSQISLSDYSMGTGLDTTGGGTGLALDLSEFTDMTGAINTAQDELILLDNGAERRKLFSEIFGSNAYNSTTIGTTTGALTVDNTTVQLNSGTTFNGSAARTLSAKTAAIANGGTALATADQIHTFVTGFGYSTLALGTTSTTALAGDTTVGTVVAANPGAGIYDTLERITIGGTSFNIPAGTGNGTVDTSGTPVDNDYAKFTDANTIEGRSTSEVKTDLSLNNVENKSSATIRGEITSGNVTTALGFTPTANTGTLTGNGATNRVPIYNGTTSFTTDSGFTYSSNILSTEKLNITAIAATTTENTTIMINGDGETLTRELGSNAYNSTTIGTNTGALTVDNATVQLNSGTTFNGSAARTLSAKTAAIANGGAALATADQIHTFVTTQTDAIDADTSGNAATATLAANSTLAGGLAIGTGRNNSANQIVRTQANGYAEFGWINTTSGNTTSTITDVYVNTNDGYIRKATNAEFKSQLGIGTNTAALTVSTGLNLNSGTTFNGSAARTISVDVSDFMTNGSNNRIVTATGADAMNAEANLTFDGSVLNVKGVITGSSLATNGVINSSGLPIISNASDLRTLIIGDTNGNDDINTIKLNVYADDKIIIGEDNTTIKQPKLTSLSAQNSEATALMINGSNLVGTRELGSNAFNSTTIGTNTGALTVSTGLNLNSGTTFNGSAARTISVDVSDFMTNGSNNRIVTATGADAMNAEANLTFDGSKLSIANPADDGGTLVLGRKSGQPNIKSSDAYLLMDSNTNFAGINYYVSQHVILGYGGGNVGIGTNSPSHKLEVNGDTAIAAINGATTSGKPMLFIGESNAYGVGFRWNSSLSLDIMDFDNVTPTSTSGTKIGHFEIRNEEFYWKGNVGIGTDAPSQKLTVAGTIMSTASSNPTLILQDSTHSDITIKGDSGIFSVTNASVGQNITMLYNGNVGIGTTSPTEKLQLGSGDNIKLAGSGGIFVEHSNAAFGGQVILPNGGMYRTQTNATTGMIKIALPGGAAPADMLSFWVDIYDYTTNESFSVFVGGYAYQTAGQNEWVNQTAMVLTTNHLRNYTVRFGHDGSNHCVLIGETNSSWNYPQVTVRDVQIGYAADIDAYNDGWVVSFVTSSPTIDETESNNFPFAQGLVSSANIPVYFGSTEEFRFETDGDFHADGDVVAQSTSVSDSRLKDNIIPIGQALDKIKSLRGVSYTWNAGKKKGKQDIGLIAQEVEKVIPEIVKDKKMPLMEGANPDETYKTIDYEKIIAVLVEAVKDQQTQIDDLKKQIKK